MLTCNFEDWGIIEYGSAREKQLLRFNTNLSAKLTSQPVTSCLIFCEHEPVITLGKSAKQSNMLFNEEWLKRQGVSVFETERGGDITFHGPGQLVAYPHFDIEQMGKGVKAFIYSIEEVIISTVKHFGIDASRYEGFTGVWIDKDLPTARKIAAIGVKCSRGVTMHGLALNVNTELKYFDMIVPCGIEGKSVTSIAKELGKEVSMSEVKEVMKKQFEKEFEVELL